MSSPAAFEVGRRNVKTTIERENLREKGLAGICARSMGIKLSWR